ncbi:zinc finger protein 723-like [Hetaerina americana]|uniref:zinc finger protein 723-like n=1 Tax=Hetaerina americana TaxID=62018 RepID=UPI003A7F50D8
MCDKAEFKLCRLCLNSRGLLMNVFGENSKLQFMLEKTIEDLIDVKVVEDANYPWLVCSNCMEKLTEFRLFKRRCAECLSVFYNRIQKGCNYAAKDWITNREKFPSEIQKEFSGDRIVSDAIDKRDVDVLDDKIRVKVEIDAGSGCSTSPVRDIDASMREGCSNTSDNVEAGNLDQSQDDELRLSFNEELVIKEEWHIDVPQEEGCLGGDESQLQDVSKGQDCVGNTLRTCQICNKGFAQEDILKAHVMDVHHVKAEEIGSDVDADSFECTNDVEVNAITYKCAICLKAFSQKYKLKSHTLIHTGDRPYYCAICMKGFHHKQHIEGHMLKHTRKRPYKCGICPKTFILEEHLRDHIRRHVGEKLYVCEVCSKAFTCQQQLMEHRLMHDGTRRHKCDICLKAFLQKAHLKRHMLVHSGERPLKCQVCFKGFLHRQHLERHMLSHTGEKPYKCEVCLKAFSVKQSLKVHMLSHTGERPHKCEVCQKTFALKQCLKVHMLIHTGEKPHKCEVCSKAFTLKQQLTEHRLTHSAPRPVKCEVCSKPFSQKRTLKRHMKMHIDINREPTNDHMTTNSHSGTNSASVAISM